MNQTYSLATLQISQAAYNEIRKLLEEADYRHVFLKNGAIDMTGIALVIKKDSDVLASYDGSYDYPGKVSLD